MPNFETLPSSIPRIPALKFALIYAGALVIIGASYFLHPLFPLALAFVFALFVFRHWIPFSVLFYGIIVFFLLISPNIPPHEKHFRSPILLKSFLVQDVLLFAALFLFVVRCIAQSNFFPKPKTLIEKAFISFTISFLFSLIIGILQGNRTEYVLSEVRDFAYLLLFWLILAYASRFERVYEFVLVFVGCCAVFAAISIVDAAVRYNFSRYNSGISFLLMGGFFFFLAALVVEGLKKSKTLFIGLLIVFLLAILVSFTRGLYLGVAVGLLVFMLRTGATQMIRLATLSVVVFGGIVVLLLLFNLTPEFLIDQTVNRGIEVGGGIDVSSAERILEIVAVMNAFPNHPIFGEGIGGTIRVYRFTDLVGRAGMTDWWFIHNNYFQTLHKQGLFGIIALLGLWMSAIWKSYRLYKSTVNPKKRVLLLTTLSTLIGFMATSITSPVMTYSNTNFLNALLFATVVIIDREQQAQSQYLHE